MELSHNKNVVVRGVKDSETVKTPGFYICPRTDADGLGFTNHFIFCDRCMSTYGKITRVCQVTNFGGEGSGEGSGDVAVPVQIAGWSVLHDVPVTVHSREKKKMCEWLRCLFKEVVEGKWDVIFEGKPPDMSVLGVQQHIVEHLLEGAASEEAPIFTSSEYHDIVSIYMTTGDVEILENLSTTVYQGDADFCPECSQHILEEFPQYCHGAGSGGGGGGVNKEIREGV